MSQEKRVWETRFIAMNQKTGELQEFVGIQYFSGVNLQEAYEQLSMSGFDYLQLTGKSFTSIDEAGDLRKFYDDISEPYNITKGMDYNEFHDWLSLGDLEGVIEALHRFREDGRVENYVEMIVGYLKHKYGWTEEEEGN